MKMQCVVTALGVFSLISYNTTALAGHGGSTVSTISNTDD